MSRRCFLCVLAILAGGMPGARAGAFMLPEGAGQFIAGVGYVEATRRFDAGGMAEVSPAFSKAYVDGYLEYGVTSTLSLILAPFASRERDVPGTNAVIGTDGSAFGARYQLYGTPDSVFAVQALVQPPVAGTSSLGADVRLLYGRGFQLFGWAAFVDLEPGTRIRTDPFPSEARLDVTLGVRPLPRLLMLFQTFSSYAPASGAMPCLAYSKVQPSLVYDFSAAWSVQAGVTRTIAGRNIVREAGPIFAVWYRF